MNSNLLFGLGAAIACQVCCSSAPPSPEVEHSPAEHEAPSRALDAQLPTVAGAPEPVDFTLSANGDRVALLVGVSKYELARDGFKPLKANQDHEVMTRALAKQGFLDDDIVSLQDAHATRSRVLEAMARMADQIEGSEAPVELAVVYYAGHGQQVTDQDGDEADGYDEALVLWGAHAKDPSGSYHLRDDDFGAALVRLQRALGPAGHLLVVMDMCHSGSSSRSAAVSRGDVPPAGPPARTARGASSTEEPSLSFEGVQGSDLATRVVISAARADQNAREIKVTYAGKRRSLGALTFALVSALDSLAHTKAVTYRDLFADVVHVVGMKSRAQTPQLEGPRDLALFGGRHVPSPTSFSVEKALGGGRFRVGAGRMIGLDVGARVSLSAPGEAAAASERLATARVVSADELEATLTIEGPPEELPTRRAIGQARVVVDQPVFSDSRLGVNVAQSDVRAFLNEHATFLQIDDGSDYVLERSRTSAGKEALVLEHLTSEPGEDAVTKGRTRGGERVFAVGLPHGGFEDVDTKATLLETLRALAQVEFLGAHTSRDERLSARLGVTRYPGAQGCLGAASARTEDALVSRVTQGESFKLDVTNTSTLDAYIYVLLLGSDRSAFLLHPPVGEAADGARVVSGRRTEIPYCIDADSPGQERVRVFVSAQPLVLPSLFAPTGSIDLEALAAGVKRAKSARGDGASSDPREALGASSDGGASRGASEKRGLTTSNLRIEVVAKAPTSADR